MKGAALATASWVRYGKCLLNTHCDGGDVTFLDL